MGQPLPPVRLIAPVDVEDVMAMCRRLHEENGLFSLDEGRVRNCIQRCFDRKGTIVGVIGSPGQLQASCCMEMTNFYYTGDTHLAELWNFVDEPYRRSRNAEALIEYGKDCARKIGIPYFTGIITNKQMAGKVRLYRRLLGFPVGAFFLYNGNWKPEPMADHGDLRMRLKAAADRWSTQGKASRKELHKISSLLKEAADVLGSEGNIWSGTPTKTNGAEARPQ